VAQKNHLSGLRRKYLKARAACTARAPPLENAADAHATRCRATAPQVSFPTTQELMDVRRELMPAIARNKAAAEAEARAPKPRQRVALR
jgi:hypothetical protein